MYNNRLIGLSDEQIRDITPVCLICGRHITDATCRMILPLGYEPEFESCICNECAYEQMNTAPSADFRNFVERALDDDDVFIVTPIKSAWA